MLKQVTVTTLKSLMRFAVVCFSFVKSDGTTRIAYGTLCDQVISDLGAEPDAPKSHATRSGVVTYFDIEKGAWRSFCESRLLGMDEDYGL